MQSFLCHLWVLPLNVTKKEKKNLHYGRAFVMIARCSFNQDFSKLAVPQGTARGAVRVIRTVLRVFF